MNPSSNGAGRVNSFAVVTYIPDPLGSFLDQLRARLEPSGMGHRAHVTSLPPRALPEDCSPDQAWDLVRRLAADFPEFAIEAGDVEIFDVSNVVYLSIGEGGTELLNMHGLLNAGPLESPEAFLYHPHITLAQGLTPDQAVEVAEEARRHWDQYSGPRRFRAHRFTFVQGTEDNRWADLAHVALVPAGLRTP